MNEIIEIYPYSNKTARVSISAPMIARRAKAGNFVILRFATDGPRIPFSIVSTDVEKGIIEIIIHRDAGLDDILQILKPGQKLPDLLGPLGQPAVIDEGKRVVCCGDGAGLVPLLPIARELHERGCTVYAVVSEESGKVSCLTEDIEKYSAEVIVAPEGKMAEIVEKTIKDNGIQKAWIAGPTLMLKKLNAVTIDCGIEASCVLNMLMLDGIGLCGMCRVIVGGERKQTCTDGPVFDAHLVDFDQLFNRQRLFS